MLRSCQVLHSVKRSSCIRRVSVEQGCACLFLCCFVPVHVYCVRELPPSMAHHHASQGSPSRLVSGRAAKPPGGQGPICLFPIIRKLLLPLLHRACADNTIKPSMPFACAPPHLANEQER